MTTTRQPTAGNSLLMRSAAQRIAAALCLIVGLWLAVAWALTGGG